MEARRVHRVFGIDGCKGVRSSPDGGFPFFLISLSMHVCEGVGRSRVFVCPWRPEVKLCYCSSRTLHFISSETVTHLAWDVLMSCAAWPLNLRAALVPPLQPRGL